MQVTGEDRMKIVVPPEMLKAVKDAEYGNPHFDYADAVLAALRWQSEHPPVPTDEQIEAFETGPVSVTEWARRWAVEWFRRAYQTEPEFCPHCGLRQDNRLGVAAQSNIAPAALDRPSMQSVTAYYTQQDGKVTAKTFTDATLTTAVPIDSAPAGASRVDVPEEVRELLRMDIIGDWFKIHAAIIEAFRRGQQAK